MRIANLLTACFQTFSAFGMDGEKWLRYLDIDPGLKLLNAIIARCGSEAIGHIQLVCRDLKIGDDNFIRVACIGNVCVHPEYRKRNVARDLLNHVYHQISGMNLPLAALLVQPGSHAWSLYSKQGYKDVYLLEDVTCELQEIKKMVPSLDESRGIAVRDYMSGDEEALLQIYNFASNSLVGIQKRDLDYWRRRYISVLTYDGFFYEPFDPEKVLVAEDNGLICGYCFLSIQNGKGYIREIFSRAEDEEIIDHLAANAMEKFASRGVRDVVFLNMLASLHPTFGRIAKSEKARISPHDQLMMKIISLPGLINSLKQEILERLKEYIPFNIELKINGCSLVLKLGSDQIILESSADNCDFVISIEEEAFLKLIFGAVSADSVIDDATASIIPLDERHKTIFRKLFPKKSFYLSPGDVW